MRRAPIVLIVAAFASLAGAAEVTLTPREITETKAVFGRVEARNVVPARARIGGTLVRLDVTEGTTVAEGRGIALVVDDKLAPQLGAADARIRALTAERANALVELERAQALLARGAGTQQRADQLKTQVDVLAGQIAAAEAERAVLLQQGADGEVKAPVGGRVLYVPVTRGAVLMPGEAVATIAGGGVYLRLALPERHAASLGLGAEVAIGEGGRQKGRIVKVFPQIENGRVIADLETADLGTEFVGQRVLVQIPVARRTVLAVPPAAIRRAAGLDRVLIVSPAGPREVVVITGNPLPDGSAVEILSGLAAGDRVVLP